MPELNDAELAQFLKGRRKGRPRLGLDCLSEVDLAAFADRAIKEEERTRIQDHLADCETCRNQVRFLVKVRKIEPAESVPAALLSRARGLPGSPKAHTWWHSWRWRAVGVLGVCSLLVVVLTLQPQMKFFVSPGVPPDQGEALSGRTKVGRAAGLRASPGRAKDSRALPMLFPSPGSTILRSEAEFRWKPTEEALHYQITLLTPEGEPVWEQFTDETSVRLPNEVKLTAGGEYFVSVRAYLENGNIVRSKAVPFTVTDRK